MKAAQNYQLNLEEMKKYVGQYVAVMDGRVVASGRDLYRKVEKLEKKNPDKEIVITYIPPEDLLIL